MFRELIISTKNREELVDVTNKVKSIVNESEIQEGLCKVFVPHTTAGITINENADPSVKTDIIKQLKDFIPKNSNYSHREGNSDAHIKSTLTGSSIDVIIHNGKIQLGTWQGIMFAEYDGPRKRKIFVQILT